MTLTEDVQLLESALNKANGAFTLLESAQIAESFSRVVKVIQAVEMSRQKKEAELANEEETKATMGPKERTTKLEKTK